MSGMDEKGDLAIIYANRHSPFLIALQELSRTVCGTKERLQVVERLFRINRENIWKET